MHIEELKILEKKGMELMSILKENKIDFTYDPAYGGYIIHDEHGTVCKDEYELEQYVKDYLVATDELVVTVDECYSCGYVLDEYCYSPTIYFKDGTTQNIEDIITGMTEQDMINYENDIRKEYDDVDYVSFGEFCPCCLSCM